MLPPEVWNIVCGHLSQFDLCTLLTVNRDIYEIALAQLYRSITIDYHYTQFDPEYVQRDPLLNTRQTYIRTKPNITAFLRSCRKALRSVRSFQVVHLPQEFIDFETKLAECLPKMENLVLLRIEQPVSLDLLQRAAPNIQHLALTLNSFRKSKHRVASLPLKTVAIGPSSQPDRLLSRLVRHPQKLEGLELVWPHRKIKLRDLVASADSQRQPLDAFSNLAHLSLVSAIISPEDQFLRNIESGLQSLCFTDINEIGQSESILDTFRPVRLRRLGIDLRQGSTDSVAPFLNRLPLGSLVELHLVIRYNCLKRIPLETLVDQYIAAIERQSASLRKISFEIRFEKELVEIQEQLSEAQFSRLFMSHAFPALESLRIQAQFAFICKDKLTFFKNLPRLHKLWILGSNAFEKHWGLGNAYPGVFDNWLRIQHLPTGLVNNEPRPKTSLRYIKLDDCLFEIKEKNDTKEIVPRDSIDSWFESQTHVRAVRPLT
ncbi:hypothetical protein KL930_003833 [Ogataea haglerorum]|uniref:F-box domain-containing protein n=1 Tax=Ogataea haglerorum TaxID=1937702 RepID=A0ABQ7RCM8_9ASCO|nr:hypothetical protein KL914_003836 [Ogataea haglerorum]KAG7716724.1 hypothetical protein KL913_003240 [Ogataea haglerorum]KAG7717523.1 hypothetical protein KL949_003357 [Ogataea haglerorum]KAG7763207.1 hypothetical protein KL946_004023 [Ogataea haglerorum]KAG7774793.1 hypothetical protein KL930_003833 [Ogataea haglerorum]